MPYAMAAADTTCCPCPRLCCPGAAAAVCIRDPVLGWRAHIDGPGGAPVMVC